MHGRDPFSPHPPLWHCPTKAVWLSEVNDVSAFAGRRRRAGFPFSQRVSGGIVNMEPEMEDKPLELMVGLFSLWQPGRPKVFGITLKPGEAPTLDSTAGTGWSGSSGEVAVVEEKGGRRGGRATRKQREGLKLSIHFLENTLHLGRNNNRDLHPQVWRDAWIFGWHR